MDIVTRRLWDGQSPHAARNDRILTMIDRRLAEAEWFAGDRFTAADIMMVFPLSTMRLFSKLDLSDRPNIVAYLARIGERPPYRYAMQKGDPGLNPLLS